MIDAQRQALLDARDDGLFDARMLGSALAALDADQISLELKAVRTVDHVHSLFRADVIIARVITPCST
ncbi:hypothetical protein [Rhodococcus erythropolis]